MKDFSCPNCGKTVIEREPDACNPFGYTEELDVLGRPQQHFCTLAVDWNPVIAPIYRVERTWTPDYEVTLQRGRVTANAVQVVEAQRLAWEEHFARRDAIDAQIHRDRRYWEEFMRDVNAGVLRDDG